MKYIRGFVSLLCMFIIAVTIVVFGNEEHTQVVSAASKESVEISGLSYQNSTYASEVIKECTVIDSYKKYNSILKKLRSAYKSAHPQYNIAHDSFYSSISVYDKAFFKKRSLCIYAFNVSETGNIIASPSFEITEIEGKKTAILSIVRDNLAGGIETPMVTYLVVDIKKSIIKGVTDYQSKDREDTNSERTPSEIIGSHKNSKEFSKYDYDSVEGMYVPYKLYDLSDANEWRAKWIPEGKTLVIKSYKKYKALLKGRKDYMAKQLAGYDKAYFKKNNLVVYGYYSSDTGREPLGVTFTKEVKDGKSKLMCSFIGGPYYGGFTECKYYYCVANVSKKAAKSIDAYETRQHTLFDRLFVGGAIQVLGNGEVLAYEDLPDGRRTYIISMPENSVVTRPINDYNFRYLRITVNNWSGNGDRETTPAVGDHVNVYTNLRTMPLNVTFDGTDVSCDAEYINII